jgi:hypothetical protein
MVLRTGRANSFPGRGSSAPIDEEEAPVAVGGRHFKKKGMAEAQSVRLIEAIFAAADDVNRTCRRRCGRLRVQPREEQLLRACGRENRRNSLQKRAALHGTPLFGSSESVEMQCIVTRIVDALD